MDKQSNLVVGSCLHQGKFVIIVKSKQRDHFCENIPWITVTTGYYWDLCVLFDLFLLGSYLAGYLRHFLAAF